jgi:hypothetical protein
MLRCMTDIFRSLNDEISQLLGYEKSHWAREVETETAMAVLTGKYLLASSLLKIAN